jgi:hypothetical protein
MIRNVIVCILLSLLTAGSLYSARIGTLEGIYKPQMLKVSGNELFVVEGHKIFVYSLPDLALKQKIGKSGEGPGEFKLDPSRTAVISVFPDFLMGEARNKIIWFTRDGKFIKEKRKKQGIIQTLPFGKNYVVLKILYGPNGKNFFAVSLYNPELKEIKELYKQKFFTYETRTFVMPDSLNYCIFDNKLFIEKSPDGFLIDVYDTQGNTINRIKRKDTGRAVTEKDKQEAFDDYFKIPYIQRIVKRLGKQEAMVEVKKFGLTYADHFPAIKYILSDGKSLYVQTYNTKNSRSEFLVMDAAGKLQKTVYLPLAKKVDFLVQMQGDKKYFHIHNNKYYYLKMIEDEDEESWELHVEEIK